MTHRLCRTMCYRRHCLRNFPVASTSQSNRVLSISSSVNAYFCDRLKDRASIEISGPEASTFLQGLITNDMDHLEPSGGDRTISSFPSLYRSLYAMFLNPQGRVIFDTLIFHIDDETYFAECDLASAPKLAAHLKKHRLRKKLDVRTNDQLLVWSIFDPSAIEREEISATDVASEFSSLCLDVEEKDAFCTVDPRSRHLGFRILCRKNPKSELQQGNFRRYRYGLGFAEGMAELVPGKALPLEYNADYAHGVSFHKGCYVGQELTARTHHTGVVRKRIMPLKFSCDIGLLKNLPAETIFVNENGKNVGTLRGCEGDDGIGLMRLQECIEANIIVPKEVKAMNALSRAPKLLRLPRPVNYRLLPTATTGVTNVKVIRPPDRGICTSVRMCSKPGHDEFTDMLKDEKERKEKESREEEEDLMVKDRVLGASLQFVPAYGWSKHSVQAGAESLGYPAVTSGIIADPAIDLILHHYESSNLKLEKIIKEELAIHGGDKRKSGSEVDELLKKYIEMRLRMNIPYMSRWSEAMAVMSYPQYAPSSLNMGLKLVDSIWHSVGDDSVDFSWYTKRLSLYAIYKSTEVAMIQDTSDDYQDTWAFLSRRFTDCQGLRDFFGTPEDVLKTLSSAAVTLKSTLGGNR